MLYTVLKQTASKVLDRRQEDSMEEKIYKIMRGAGALNIVLGVISLVVGIAADHQWRQAGLRQITYSVLITNEKENVVRA